MLIQLSKNILLIRTTSLWAREYQWEACTCEGAAKTVDDYAWQTFIPRCSTDEMFTHLLALKFPQSDIDLFAYAVNNPKPLLLTQTPKRKQKAPTRLMPARPALSPEKKGMFQPAA